MIVPETPPIVYLSHFVRLLLAIAVSIVFAAALPLWLAAPLTVGLLLAAVPWRDV